MSINEIRVAHTQDLYSPKVVRSGGEKTHSMERIHNIERGLKSPIDKANTLSKIFWYTRELAYAILAAPLVLSAVVLTPVIAPLVAVTCTGRYCFHSIQLSKRAQNHLSNGTNGRLPGQDYTKWNGQTQSISNQETSTFDREGEEIGYYHCGVDREEIKAAIRDGSYPTDSPFNNEEDLNWLNREYAVRTARDALDSDLDLLRICAKAMIPILGLIWIAYTEVDWTRDLNKKYDYKWNDSRVNRLTGKTGSYYWHWRKAIEFHRTSLKEKLSL